MLLDCCKTTTEESLPVRQSFRENRRGWGIVLCLLFVAAPKLVLAQSQAPDESPTPTPAAPEAFEGPHAAGTPAPAALEASEGLDAAGTPVRAVPEVAPAPSESAPVARIGVLPAPLTEELEFTLGHLIEAANVQAAFIGGAWGAILYDGQQLLVFRRTGESRAFPYAPSNEPREHQIAEAIAQWLGPPPAVQIARVPTPVVSPRGTPVAPARTAPPAPMARIPMERASRRRPWRQMRTALRRARPWRLRLAFGVLATPRDAYGDGPYAGSDADLVVFPGLGAQVTASRYLSAFLRLDLQLTVAKVFGDWNVDGGPEGSLGGAIMVVGRGRTRLGGGLGLDMLVVQERELGGDDDFGWLSPRVDLIGELAWTSPKGLGVSIQLAPTFTYVPYAKRFHPGALFSVGFELGVGGSLPSEPSPSTERLPPTHL